MAVRPIAPGPQYMIKILAFSGSSSPDSVNQKLLDRVTAGARAAGAVVTTVRLADFNMPIYCRDWEADHGVPPGARDFQAVVADHDALIIASPEHNGGYTALLKNAIDWLSRPLADGRSGVSLVSGKLAAVVSASPGILGGIRSQTGMRVVLEKLGVVVIPQSIALGGAPAAFDDDGCLKDSTTDGVVRGIGGALVGLATRLR